jgi:acid stress-induced BolA-like protein IbaG/YrbA
MKNEEVKALIEAAMPGAIVDVSGDGYHYNAHVISEVFDGVKAVKRQQMVYAAVEAPIADGSLHALTIKAQTPEEASS